MDRIGIWFLVFAGVAIVLGSAVVIYLVRRRGRLNRALAKARALAERGDVRGALRAYARADAAWAASSDGTPEAGARDVELLAAIWREIDEVLPGTGGPILEVHDLIEKMKPLLADPERFRLRGSLLSVTALKELGALRSRLDAKRALLHEAMLRPTRENR